MWKPEKHATIGKSQVYITPRHILDSLGTFDLDPAGADPRPWDCAKHTYTADDDGLALPWFGRVWLNPPFDTRQIERWIERLAEHDFGTALLHARTETRWFGLIWEHASAVKFLAGRIVFHKPDGSLCTTKSGKIANSGAPPVLVAFGPYDADILKDTGLPGKFIPLEGK